MNVNVFLFDDFNSMDVFGPVEVFGKLPEHFHINYWSVSGNIINSSQGAKLWTEPVDEEMENGILLIPGGRGARRVIHHGGSHRTATEAGEQCRYLPDGCRWLWVSGPDRGTVPAQYSGVQNE